MTNRLINETSPYLLQHAHNPVDWFPWGEEAFAKAKAEDKPVLVSIGYAACHWCHVMERESFENEDIAAAMNERFVAIKVDREERPDIDAIYMRALQTLRGQGGWPLNVFLLPDGRPFYGGTYFPSESRHGMPSWPDVLQAVADAYSTRPDAVLQNAAALTEALQATSPGGTDEFGPEVSAHAFEALASFYDSEEGGFGSAPKFPQTMPIEFLLRLHQRTGSARARDMALHSLRKMADGGIYDHLGGGFARYSTDSSWLVPHFEKMLYDNALLASAYVQAFQLTRDDGHRTVASETLDYVLRDLAHPAGGFYSSQDADSEGVEGKYYVWDADEVRSALGESDAAVFCRVYGVSDVGNFEGRNILHLVESPGAVAAELGIAEQALRSRLDDMRATLLALRAQRVAPATDDKVLTAWNGLMLRALAEAGAVLDNARYVDAAERNATFLLGAMRPDGRLLRTWKDGRAHLLGYLEDYAFLINGLISLHEATFAHRWLHAARELCDEMIGLFWDGDTGGMFDVGADHERLIVRPRERFDNAIPSGESAAAEALLRLGVIGGDEEYLSKAALLLRGAAPTAGPYALGHGNWLKVFELYFAEPMEVAIVGGARDADTRALLSALHARYAPSRVVVGLDPEEPRPYPSPIIEGRGQIEGRPTAYVCKRYACALPTRDPDELAAQLAG